MPVTWNYWSYSELDTTGSHILGLIPGGGTIDQVLAKVVELEPPPAPQTDAGIDDEDDFKDEHGEDNYTNEIVAFVNGERVASIDFDWPKIDVQTETDDSVIGSRIVQVEQELWARPNAPAGFDLDTLRWVMERIEAVFQQT